MTNINETARERIVWPSGRAALFSHLFGLAALTVDFLVIVTLSVAVGVGYHFYISGGPGEIQNFLKFGGLIGLFYMVNQSAANRYETREIAEDTAVLRRTFRSWTLALFCTLCVAFLLKEMNVFSRGSVILLFGAGFAALAGLRAAFVYTAHTGLARGWLASRRVLLLGTDAEIRNFRDRHDTARAGFQIAGAGILPTLPSIEASLSELARYDAALRRVADTARRLRVDEILVLVPWSDRINIEHCVDALMAVPAAVHLGPEKIFARFHDIEISRIGTAATLRLTRVPLSPLEVLAKRIFDVIAAALGLVLLAPLFAAIAALIRLDSGGPVLFTQQRHGFSQRPFRIVKFRTMNTADDGEIVPQAIRKDPRITRVGRVLRRWNLDELPQLVNVLAGDMSIVGPRPHAVAHNNDYQTRIALYARRHNVKPGITGWAQIHGLRGRTDTDDKMRARIEHDLYYIDNWSFWLDLYIVAMTLLSTRAFRNAG
jgi:Undecaprenyl-phosphate glucose phosphotransferase